MSYLDRDASSRPMAFWLGLQPARAADRGTTSVYTHGKAVVLCCCDAEIEVIVVGAPQVFHAAGLPALPLLAP